MFCDYPRYISRVGYIPCGHCEKCKISRKKEVSDRLMIERKYHSHNYFVTLTYRPELQPVSVERDDLIKFNKRLAYYCGGMPKFYAVGEYGDESALAHYHLAIFSDKDIFNKILKSWEFGRVGIEHMEDSRCKYIAGYVAKKMNKPDDPRLQGRKPEFCMCSRRPALGFFLLYDILERMVTDANFRKIMLSHIFPPYSIMLGDRKIMLPRYVREKLRPLYADIEEIQYLYKQQKAERDFAVSEKIKENVQRMCLEEGFRTDKTGIDTMLFEKRKVKNDAMKKVAKIKQKRII